jgi:WD40 repeat protein
MRIWKYPFLGKDHSHHLLHGLTFPGPLLGIAYKPDKTTLVTAVGLTREDPESRSHSGVVATWNMNLDDDDKVLTEFDPDAKRPTEPLVGFGVSPDGRFLVSSTRNRDLVFVPLNNNDIHGSERQILPVHVTLNTKIQVRCINKDGNIDNMNNTGCFNNEYLVMGVADRNDIGDAAASPGSGLCMWRIHDTGPPEKPNFQFEPGTNPCLTPPDPAAPQNSSTGNLHNVGMFDISHDGKKIIMSVDSPTSTCVVLQKTHDLLNALHGDKSSFGCTSKSSGFNSQFAALSFSPDGGNIAATDIGSRMYFWPVKYTSKMPDESDDTLGSVTMFARGQVIAFPPPDVDADRDLVAVGLQDATIMLWNSKYRRIIMKIHQHHGGILGLAFSPDGNVLVSTGNDGVVKVMGDVNR